MAQSGCGVRVNTICFCHNSDVCRVHGWPDGQTRCGRARRGRVHRGHQDRGHQDRGSDRGLSDRRRGGSGRDVV